MSIVTEHSFNVAIYDLAPISVAYTFCKLQQAMGSYSEQIRDGFERMKRWARQHGYDLSTLRLIGVPHTSNAQLIGYDCALEIPEASFQQVRDVPTKLLPGGRFAVLSLEKDSSAIGESIGRFFAEYVPQHRLIVDAQRLSYEIYYELTMDLCVPIQ